MLGCEVLIFELGTVDTLSSCTVGVGEVTHLDHEALDQTMRDTALVVQWFAHGAHALLTSTEGSEVFSCFWHQVGEELELDSLWLVVTNGDVKEDLGITGIAVVLWSDLTSQLWLWLFLKAFVIV